MNHIELFGKEGQKQQAHLTRIEEKRPQKLNISKVVSENQKWVECKIIGKNISIRSYSAACVFDNKYININFRLWIYGGYQILNGLMSDFYYIDLSNKQSIFNWAQVIPAQKNLPGSRAKHSLVSTGSHIYLIGGLYSDIKSTDTIYRFSPPDLKWQLVKTVGDQLPPLDSFGCCLAQRQGFEVIIIACGYNGLKGKYSNAIYEYAIAKNQISILFEGGEQSSNAKYPIPRSGLAMVSQGCKVYLFGGKNDDYRMNDLWLFNLNDCKFSKMPEQGIVPSVRNGHTLNISQGKLYLFGGIHDITWQLDDLHIYSIERKEWATLEQDSARKIQKKKVKEQDKKDKKLNEKSPKKNWYDTSNSLYGNKSNSPLMKNSIYKEEDQGRSISPGKMIDEQRKKAFYNKKAQMLKMFQVTQTQKDRYIAMQTSSQAMKNSLDVIGNPNPKVNVPQGKITDFGKETASKFLEPLQNNSNLVIGKRPCARDGHCSVLIDKQLIIFGGDRHQMSFNDIYKLNLQLAKHQIDI